MGWLMDAQPDYVINVASRQREHKIHGEAFAVRNCLQTENQRANIQIGKGG